VGVYRRSIHAFHDDLADAGGQLRSPEATAESATNAQLLTGCTKCPMADRKQRQAQHGSFLFAGAYMRAVMVFAGEGPVGGARCASNIPVIGL
jgi:hypothetical protein